ncbi:D,D-heptose 1,7-bisphosphate phosphatase [Fusobacterium necrogenes]|uniref:D,D-heptose 1,7-bisphosphate phosphatase n=1 Tax=Fusobacterium necrogenes TaxID=858 RepID=A0A377GZA3_9FUSO|nr:D-glycero-beta-D-manno-heptose 1,7-bisphosphate 7-phosphatase [Fusobacterium necrogenes]STO32193.1 D,D-heptose 1,7-bisphosphate phosphatase [Fusobacterium necrogenes]
MNKAIILDRDGTINIEKDYLHKIEDFEFEEGVVEGLKILADLGYIFVVVTNQSGIARGYYTEEDLEILNNYIGEILEKEGIKIKKFYFCPHHPEKGVGKYKVECNCRKPNPGMLEEAIKEFDIDREKSFMIGDNISDIEAGINANVTPILLETGHGMEHLTKIKRMKVKNYRNLLDFANFLKENLVKNI